MIYFPHRAISSVVERFIDIEEAGSSILPSRTHIKQGAGFEPTPVQLFDFDA